MQIFTKFLFFTILSFSFLKANQYDYLLYSYVLSDVQSGLELGADVNAKINNVTPLYEAVRNNRLEIAYLLIMNRADVNALASGINNNESILHKATENKNGKLVELLISAGANVNVKDGHENTPLHYAAINSDMVSKNALLNAGADMNAKNAFGITPSQIVVAEILIPPIIIEDNNVAVSASAFKVASSNVIFNVRNLTNEPLRILLTEIYINGQLIARNTSPLTLPPSMTITNVNAMQIPVSALNIIKPDKDGVAEVKAGVNIQYFAEGEVQNVFNGMDLMVQLWRIPESKQNKSAQNKSSQNKTKE